MGGPVAAGITYEDWFADQERSRQLEILGPGRLEMYEKGELSVADMANVTARPKTLDELRGFMKEREMASIGLDSPVLHEFFETIVQKTKGITQDIIPCDIPITMRAFTEDEIRLMIKQGEDPSTIAGLCLHSKRHHSKRIAEYIVIKDGYVRECYNSKLMPGWDGYKSHVYDNVPPDLQVAYMIAHEMAHIKYGPHYTRSGIGESMHAKMTKQLIAALTKNWQAR